MKDATHHGHSRTALVLSGGGANGAYELGVMKALIGGLSPSTHHRPLTPSTIAATSIGAFNGSVLLSNLDHSWPSAVDALEQVWVERMASPSVAVRNGVMRYRMNPIDWADQIMHDPMGPARDFAADAMFLARDWTARVAGFVGSTAGLAGRVAELFDASQFLTAEPSASLVQESVDAGRIRDLAGRVDFRVTTTAWQTGTLRVFENRDFTDDKAALIVRASGALPGIFPAVPIGAELFVDGGVVLNTPLSPAIQGGADVLHVIYLDPSPGAIPMRPLSSMVDAMSRMLVASFAATMRRDLEVAAKVNADVKSGKDHHRRAIEIHLYRPVEDMGGALGMLDFHRPRVTSLIERGYRDAIGHDCKANGCVVHVN